ncbi:hypothetical protein [Ramlibacter sp. WS9]|uniref:DUF6916 family protein n=1 Tax=Ramlibacter sp. WS9 TaxID=1882741 RepID=UPI001143CD16|nr:hypothetical protein [Ramlibacter sp. WS9]ROZ62393.1 hypothetical protein EEB15_31260 [Ramlibacter sp. WS9]
MIEQLTRQDFLDLSPDDLSVEHEGQQLKLQVLETRDLPPISPRQSPFVVVLGGPPSPVLPQGIYGLLHARHGRHDLFIVPISRDAEYTRYELIFN